MDRKAFRNGMLLALLGAVFTLLGDFLLSSGEEAVSAGSPMLDMVIDSIENSDLRMVIAGMLGVVGVPLEGVGYYQLSLLFREEKGIGPAFYRWSVLAYIGLAGCGVHAACAAAPLLYKWIMPYSAALAAEVAEKYLVYFMLPPMIVFGVMLFLALVYQTIVIAKKKTIYPGRAAWYNMAVGVAAAYILAAIIGGNAVGNAIGTGGISIGHIWMFGMFLLKMPKEGWKS